MYSYGVEIGGLVLIERREAPAFPENNKYSTITRYRCQCGGGEIVRYDNKGVGDRFATLKCPECRKRLRPFVGIEGDYFRLTLL